MIPFMTWMVLNGRSCIQLYFIGLLEVQAIEYVYIRHARVFHSFEFLGLWGPGVGGEL